MQKTMRKHTHRQRVGGRPRRLGKIAEGILSPAFRARGFAHTRLVTHWHDIAGAEAAAWSSPARITFPRGKTTGGTLEVAIAPGRGPEMQMLAAEIITRCNAVFGYAAISRITITQTDIQTGNRQP